MFLNYVVAWNCVFISFWRSVTTSQKQNKKYWTILQIWVQERKSSHWRTFMLLLALCAPKVLGCNLVSGMVQRWADNPIFSGWVTRASLVFRAEIRAFEAMFTMFIFDVTVVHAWDPGVDQRWDRGWGWGNWGVAIKVEGGEGWHVRPPNWHHSAPPRSSRRGGKDMERAMRRNQRSAGGRLSKGSLVICCSLSTRSPCSSTAVKGGDGDGDSSWSLMVDLPPRDENIRVALLPASTSSSYKLKIFWTSALIFSPDIWRKWKQAGALPDRSSHFGC